MMSNDDSFSNIAPAVDDEPLKDKTSEEEDRSESPTKE